MINIKAYAKAGQWYCDIDNVPETQGPYESYEVIVNTVVASVERGFLNGGGEVFKVSHPDKNRCPVYVMSGMFESLWGSHPTTK